MQVKSNSKQYNHIISNYDKYNLSLDSQEDMLRLLNILEAHGETLDSLHDCRGQFDGFCNKVNVYDDIVTDAELADGILATNAFYKSKEEFLSCYLDDDDYQDYVELWEDNIKHGDTIQTTDGYVEINIV